VFGVILRASGLLIIGALVALLVYGLVKQSPDTTIDDGLLRGEAIAAPGFTLELLERGRPPELLGAVLDRAAVDGRVSLDELRGTPIVLNFWASWCEPCRSEAPILERRWRRAGRQGVLFVGVNIQDVRSDARQFMREFGVTYPTLREGDRDTAARYGATGIPETFFISARGTVVAHVLGAITPEQLRDGVASARSGRPQGLGSGGDVRKTR